MTAEWKVSFVRSRTSLAAATEAASSAETAVNSLAPFMVRRLDALKWNNEFDGVEKRVRCRRLIA